MIVAHLVDALPPAALEWLALVAGLVFALVAAELLPPKK